MWKRLSKVWAWIEHIHTVGWVIGILGGASIITSIFRYITNHYSYLDLIVFCVSILILSVPLFISRYTRNIKSNTKTLVKYGKDDFIRLCDVDDINNWEDRWSGFLGQGTVIYKWEVALC